MSLSRPRTWFLLLLASLSGLGAAAAAGEEREATIAVVANPNGAPGRIRLEQLADLFLARTAAWPDGRPALPVHQTADRPIRESFVREVLGLSPEAAAEEILDSAWREGRSSPPDLPGDREVLLWVERQPGAVGYVHPESYPGARVLLVDVTGCSVCVDRDRPARERRLAAPVVLEAVGPCRGSDGRRFVLASRRSDATLLVELERSTWRGGRRVATSRQRVRLGPGEERGMGCAVAEGEEGERIEIAGVSDESAPPVAAEGDDPSRPWVDEPVRARQALTVLEGASCGPDGAGKEIVLVSRARRGEVGVEIEIHEELVDVDGSGTSRTFRRRVRLGPGAREELGCSRTGKLVRKVSVLTADWRR